MVIYYSKTTGGFYDDTINIQIPADAVIITDQLRQSLLLGESNGNPIRSDANGMPVNVSPAPLSLSQQIAMGKDAIQAAMDKLAGEWGYGTPIGGHGSIVSAISYLDSTNEQWKADAVKLSAWRDEVWTWAHTQQAAIIANPALLPSTIEGFLVNMPAAPSKS